MAIPRRNVRGLQDIRTLTGRADQAAVPYKTYLKLGCLEMEQLRRGKERESTIYRTKNIDQRLKEIEAEKAVLLQILGEPHSSESVAAQDSASQPAPGRSTGGIRLRY